MEMSLSTRTVDGHTVLEVGGEIDVYTARQFRDHLSDILVNPEATRLIVDIRRVEFFDSSGLGVLVGIHRRCRALGGGLAVVAPHERLLKIFRITGLDAVLAIYDSVDDAIAASQDPTVPQRTAASDQEVPQTRPAPITPTAAVRPAQSRSGTGAPAPTPQPGLPVATSPAAPEPRTPIAPPAPQVARPGAQPAGTLTKVQEYEIIYLWHAGKRTIAELAEEYSVPAATVHKILSA
jgi:anti-sigma B factor antagonist